MTSITNGVLSYTTGTVYQSVASYACDLGYYAIGNASCTCTSNGTWSDVPPICQIMGSLKFMLC